MYGSGRFLWMTAKRLSLHAPYCLCALPDLITLLHVFLFLSAAKLLLASNIELLLVQELSSISFRWTSCSDLLFSKTFFMIRLHSIPSFIVKIITSSLIFHISLMLIVVACTSNPAYLRQKCRTAWVRYLLGQTVLH